MRTSLRGKNRLALLAGLVLALAFGLCACGSGSSDGSGGNSGKTEESQAITEASDVTDEYDESASIMEQLENVPAAEGDVVEVDPHETLDDKERIVLREKAAKNNKDVAKFYGTWKAKKEEAYDLYGHLIITIKKDGTFDMDVIDEKFSGKWKKTPEGLRYTSELMKGYIYYNDYNEITITNDDYDEEELGFYVTMDKIK